MKQIRNLQIKIKRLLQKLKFPVFLHRFGPKKYKLENHISGLSVMQICQTSLRRTSKLTEMFGQKCPTYSALCKSRKRIPVDLMIGLVAGESSWRNDVVHHNGGSNDFGLFQLNSLWHNQHKSSLINHIKAGVDHYKWCLKTEKNSSDKALARYNTGGSGTAAGRQYASYIKGKKREIDRKAKQYLAAHTSRGSISSRRS